MTTLSRAFIQLQNLGEAEYAIALFQYMRLVGYPASSIAILTTYNGQKALLRDIAARRCAPYGVFGAPARIETVDKFQGQQADYVILSLVRTRAVGHLRDVRRLVVAMSRARLGLYVLGRASLFSNCFELAATFEALQKGRPQQLQLLLGEAWPSQRPAELPVEEVIASASGPLSVVSVDGVAHLGAIVARILAVQMSMALGPSGASATSSTKQAPVTHKGVAQSAIVGIVSGEAPATVVRAVAPSADDRERREEDVEIDDDDAEAKAAIAEAAAPTESPGS